MKNYYEKEQLVSSAYADRSCHLGVYQASLLMQDMVTEWFYALSCDAIRLSKTHRAVWAVVRAKFHFIDRPAWHDTVRVRVFPIKISPATVHVNMTVHTLDGRLMLWGRQELCVIDAEDHHLRRVDSTPFPMDMECFPAISPLPFQRTKMQIAQEDSVGQVLVRPMDTDMNAHLNNVAAIRLIFDLFPSSFWDTHFLTDFDMHYISEGREGDILSLYRKKTEKGYAVQICAGEKALIRAFLEVAHKTKNS